MPTGLKFVDNFRLDDRLIAVQVGKPGARDELVHALYALLRKFFRRRCSPLDAEDLVQATLVAIFPRVPDFEPTRPDGFEAMVYATAARILATKRRSLAREHARRVQQAPLAIASGTSPSSRAIRRQFLDQVLAVIDRLRSTDQRTLEAMLRSADWREQVEREGVARSSLRGRLFRALARLRDQIQRSNPALLLDSGGAGSAPRG